MSVPPHSFRRGAFLSLAALSTLGLAVVVGCTSTTAMVGPRPPATYTAERRAQGRACGFLILGVIPTGSFQRRTEIAYERALKDGGRALTDTGIQHSWYVIPYVGYLLCTRLEGKVVD